MKNNLKIKREERRREENPLRTPILVLARLLIQRGSVLKAKLRMAKWGLAEHVPWYPPLLRL
jgi:hypothetical protein